MIDHLAAELQRAQEICEAANSIVALTGAGISTPSGIPDFRSPDSGLWERANPMDVATIWAFQQNPAAFYDWVRPLIDTTLQAKPNPAHLALTDLETYGPLDAVITQNIDGLHTEAGTKTVYEVHGHTRTASCLSCGKPVSGDAILEQIQNSAEVPRCDLCNGLIKPDVILFGEMLPADIMRSAEKAVNRCDVLIVIGSSLEVAPVSEFPMIARRLGAKIININRERTPIDALIDVSLHGDVVEVLPQLVERFR